ARPALTQSNVTGIYLAGACQSPMDIRSAMAKGAAAAGCILSELAPPAPAGITS
ncbi:MAG: hypothetical protein GY953_46880, partial [bacterium]|nr:hypothetical protein [bacterium]